MRELALHERTNTRSEIQIVIREKPKKPSVLEKYGNRQVTFDAVSGVDRSSAHGGEASRTRNTLSLTFSRLIRSHVTLFAVQAIAV